MPVDRMREGRSLSISSGPASYRGSTTTFDNRPRTVVVSPVNEIACVGAARHYGLGATQWLRCDRARDCENDHSPVTCDGTVSATGTVDSSKVGCGAETLVRRWLPDKLWELT